MQDEAWSPWMRRALKEYCCSETGTSCTQYETYRDLGLKLYHYTEYMFDVIMMYANATGRVIRKYNCDAYRGEQLRRCVGGQRLLDELKATNQRGLTGMLELDAKGERHMLYVIKQSTRLDGYVEIGVFDSHSRKLSMNKASISWPDGDEVPSSMCSVPCNPYFGRVFTTSVCCWMCRRCRRNEIVNQTTEQCAQCPNMFWPSKDGKRCEALELHRHRWDQHIYGYIHIGVVGLLVVLAVVCLVVHVKRRKVNIAEMNTYHENYLFIMLLGVVVGLLATLLFLFPPETTLCYSTYSLIVLSYSLVLVPLFVCTGCLLLVGEMLSMMGERNNEKGLAIRTEVQSSVTACIIVLQVLTLFCFLM
jgi:hypothetical protein